MTIQPGEGVGAEPHPATVLEDQLQTQPFGIDQAAIDQRYPSVAASRPLFHSLEDTMITPEQRREAGQIAATGMGRQPLNRGGRRSLGPLMAVFPVVYSAAQLIASSDERADGLRFTEDLLRDASGPLFEGAWELFWKDNILGIASNIQGLRDAGRGFAEEVIAGRAAEPTQDYSLLKALAHPGDEITQGAEAPEWRGGRILAGLSVLGGLGVRRELTADLNEGRFDEDIAGDMVRFADGTTDSGVYARIRQLGKFATAVLGREKVDDAAALQDRIAAAVDEWPVDERRIILDARQMLRAAIDTNHRWATNTLSRRFFLLPAEELPAAFEDALLKLNVQFLPTVQVNAGNRQELARLRTRKRRYQPPVMPEEPLEDEAAPKSAEAVPEPSKLVVCNMADRTVSENVNGMVEEFVNNARQGEVTVRQDVDAMLKFLARNDLPAAHRRGIFTVQQTSVRFPVGEAGEEKELKVYEMKPTMASGLPLVTDVVKNSRVYFVRLGNDTIGILGIQPKTRQKAFIGYLQQSNIRRG